MEIMHWLLLERTTMPKKMDPSAMATPASECSWTERDSDRPSSWDMGT